MNNFFFLNFTGLPPVGKWSPPTTKIDDNRGRMPAASLFGRLHARVDKTKLVVAPITDKLHVNE